MRAPLLGKTLFCVSNVAVLVFVLYSLTDFTKISLTKYNDTVIASVNNIKDSNSENRTVLKYILQWTSPRNVPFNSMGVGQEGFISRNCSYKNCFVTGDRKYLGDVTKFDVIVFAGPEVVTLPSFYLPQSRAHHQKYVFASIESSGYYPVCSNRFDGFFNWTWTFRLDSDVRWGYMLVKDAENNIIGPNKIMHWMKLEDMSPVSEEFKQKLKTKKKAAAWFVSNCFDRSGRFEFAEKLKYKLKSYNLMLDIYGKCGQLSCPPSEHEKCLKMLDETYYFYLSFENSFSEDYATEKLLMALQNNVVPIVYGGANYTRFMPYGIYLNAKELGVTALAAKMAEIIKNPEQYANFFRWKNHYSYHSKHEIPETNEYCKMCELLNNEEKLKKTSIISNFKDWWDSPNMCNRSLF
ncbi:alpha-(1,3)-fucosyltransferase C-like [Ostrinia furnacalis]|uniref:alpha-(1,3)-fucosyltransferase C-like n=1 Tax=Ostrinia furnacalis TaxID=93504 RepID=UPI0010388924|nr:alpha-(1,3)-fucosyltransferase C-like [Ostrinia furnacalis]